MRLSFRKDVMDDLFFRDLANRVNLFFKLNRLKKHANAQALAKAVLLFSVYLFLQVYIFFADSLWLFYLCYMLSGILSIFVALNIGHDAAHNCFVKSKRLNNFLTDIFDLLGTSGYIWKEKHVFSHHAHVNIPRMDADIRESKLVRFFPDTKWEKINKYQYIYMWMLYPLYTFLWSFIWDFQDIFNYKISGKPQARIPKLQVFKILFYKFFFVARLIIIPALVLPFSWSAAITAFLIMSLSASVTITFVLVSAHVGEHNNFPEPNEKGNMPTSWVRHQIITTCDFATNNKMLSHLFGCFNHHLAHHLFPNICHIYYPQLTRIVKKTCAEYGMPYMSNPSLIYAIRSHHTFLKMRSADGERMSFIDL